MNKDVLVSVTVSREKEEIVYRVDCSNEIKNDELEYYLQEIIKGICTWKPGVCEGTVKNFNGTIKKRKTKK